MFDDLLFYINSFVYLDYCFFFLWLLGFLVLFSGIVKVNGYDIMIDIDKVC